MIPSSIVCLSLEPTGQQSHETPPQRSFPWTGSLGGFRESRSQAELTRKEIVSGIGQARGEKGSTCNQTDRHGATQGERNLDLFTGKSSVLAVCLNTRPKPVAEEMRTEHGGPVEKPPGRDRRAGLSRRFAIKCLCNPVHFR